MFLLLSLLINVALGIVCALLWRHTTQLLARHHQLLKDAIRQGLRGWAEVEGNDLPAFHFWGLMRELLAAPLQLLGIKTPKGRWWMVLVRIAVLAFLVLCVWYLFGRGIGHGNLR